jgi:RimJ/RimL family protein N-acetyltransferase
MLAGEKITLRAIQADDVDAMYEIAAELSTWEERNPSAPRPLSQAEYVESFTKRVSERSDDLWFAVETDGRLVGQVSMFHVDPLARTAEVGIALHPSARGQGYGTDALRILVRFAFERCNLRRVYLTALASNAGGLACYRKVGFIEEGRRRENAWVRGRYEDEIQMGLLRSEWTGSEIEA